MITIVKETSLLLGIVLLTMTLLDTLLYENFALEQFIFASILNGLFALLHYLEKKDLRLLEEYKNESANFFLAGGIFFAIVKEEILISIPFFIVTLILFIKKHSKKSR